MRVCVDIVEHLIAFCFDETVEFKNKNKSKLLNRNQEENFKPKK